MEDNAYENIFTAGLLLGMSRQEIERQNSADRGVQRTRRVSVFTGADLFGRNDDAPRLCAATTLDPGILLMDEGIGAGDARFAERAEQRLNEFIGRSQIIVVASHSPALIKGICNKAALMVAGQLLAVGPVEEVFERYEANMRRADASKAVIAPTAPIGGDMVAPVALETECNMIASNDAPDEASKTVGVSKDSGSSEPLMSFGRIDLRDWAKRTGGTSGAKIEWAELHPSRGSSNGDAIQIGLDIRLMFQNSF